MTQIEMLNQKTDALILETKTALETILAELNQGQRKKLERNEKVKALLDRYGVEYNELQ